MILTAGKSCTTPMMNVNNTFHSILVSDNTHLQWRRQQDRHTIQTLNDLDEFLILRQVDDDHRLDIGPIRHVSHDTEGREEDGDYDHDT